MDEGHLVHKVSPRRTRRKRIERLLKNINWLYILLILIILCLWVLCVFISNFLTEKLDEILDKIDWKKLFSWDKVFGWERIKSLEELKGEKMTPDMIKILEELNARDDVK